MALKIANRGVVPPFIVMDVLRDALTLEAHTARDEAAITSRIRVWMLDMMGS